MSQNPKNSEPSPSSSPSKIPEPRAESSVSFERDDTQRDSKSTSKTLLGPVAYFDRSSFELLIFRGWELMCRIRDTVLLRPKNPEDSPVKDDHERPLTRQKKNKNSSTSISPVSKIAVVTATLAALAMTFYDQFSKSDPNVAVVKLDRDQASDPSIKLGLPKGPPELLKGILGDLTKKAEKAKQNGTSLSPLEQQRLDLLQQKKQKGEL